MQLDLRQEDKIIFNDVIKRVDNYLPKKYKDNFYNNLTTLKVIYNIKNMLPDNLYAYYNHKENIICLDIDAIRNKFKDYTYLDDLIKCIIAHELFHLASSSYEEDKVNYSGINNYYNHSNIDERLNEGITDILAHVLYYKIPFSTSIYLDDMIHIKRLEKKLGTQEIYDSYFIKHELKKINKR